jgi:hypothetical protein
MSKAVLMLELGWTSRQFYEENTSEDIAQLLLVIEKREAVRNYPKPPIPSSKTSMPSVRKGPVRRFH